MKPCIYCLEKKDESAFNTEHVIPQAFGHFEGNLTLDCVCRACNDHFGKTIDLKFARDSIEGLDRFWSGVKPATDFKSYGKRGTTRVRFEEGPSKGASGYFVANPDGGDLRVFHDAQIGFVQPPGETKWFRRENVPEKSELRAMGFDGPFEIHIREMSAEEATALLTEKGFTNLTDFSSSFPTEETVATHAVGIIGRPEKRAATKIAINYLAYVLGPAPLRSDPFNDVRNFARYDLGDSRVHIAKNPLGFARDGVKGARGHYLAVQTMPSGRVVAQVCLMLRIRYVVHLMSANFTIGRPAVSSAHFFNIDKRDVRRVSVPPLVDAELLPVAGDESDS